MSDNDRYEWYKAALMTIGDMPADLLADACAAARKVCDHPAKIVPFICSHDPSVKKHWQDTLRWRKRALNDAQAKIENINAKRIGATPTTLPEGERISLATDLGALVKELERKTIIQ